MVTKEENESADNPVCHARQGWFWCGVEQLSQQGLRMLVSLLLARLLAPETFGIVASAMIFLAVARNLIDGGIGARIVQKPDIRDEDYTALFWCNGLMALVSCGVLALSAGLIAEFYGNPSLRVVVLVMSVVTFFMTSGRVQQCQLIRHFKFRTSALITMVSVASGSVVGVLIALNGGGVWAILGQQLVLSVVQAVILWLVLPWRPRHWPRWAYVKDLYAFGLPIMVSQTIRSGAEQTINVLTGKFVGMAQLGFLDRGCFIPNNVCLFLQNVFFRTNYAILSRAHSDSHAFRAAYVQLMRGLAILLLVGMAALAASAPEVIELLIGPQWLPATRLFQAGAVMTSFNLLFYVHLDVLKACGQVAHVFRQNVLYALLEVTGVGVGLAWGLPGMLVGAIMARGAAWLMMMRTVYRSSGVTLGDMLRVFLRPMLWALLTLVLVSVVRRVDFNLWVRFILCGLSGGTMLLIARWLEGGLPFKRMV